MNTIKERMEVLSDELAKVEGFVDEINRMQIGKTYVDDVCKTIQTFISQEFARLQEVPNEEKPPAVFAMINSILAYSNNYMAKHTRDMYVLHGRVLEKQEAAEKIKSTLQSYENQMLSEERIQEKIANGDDIENRAVGERPEKIADVRRAIENQQDDSDT